MGYNMVTVGSKWRSNAADYAMFEVRGIENRSDGVWVSYGKHAEDRTYECLVDAFLERFREHVN